MSSYDEDAAMRAATQMGVLANTSLAAEAEMCLELSYHSVVSRAELMRLLNWAHSTVQLQIIGVMTEQGVIFPHSAGYMVNQPLAQAVRLCLRMLATTTTALPETNLYITPPELAGMLAGGVGEIRQLLIELIASAHQRLTIVTAFFSTAALEEILTPLKARSGVEVSLYLSLPERERGRGYAVISLLGNQLASCATRLYINIRSEGPTAPLPHAKLLLCDGIRGYLGSANLSWHGLHEQFEVGVKLDKTAVILLERTLSHLVTQGLYTPWL